jgi:hypothetical protein
MSLTTSNLPVRLDSMLGGTLSVFGGAPMWCPPCKLHQIDVLTGGQSCKATSPGRAKKENARESRAVLLEHAGFHEPPFT